MASMACQLGLKEKWKMETTAGLREQVLGSQVLQGARKWILVILPSQYPTRIAIDSF